MRKGRLFASLLIAVCGLLLMLGGIRVQRPAQAAGASRSAAAAQVITSTFSYQGLLEEGGQPASGNRQMVFTLYTDGACTNQVGSSQTDQVAVEDGVFSVDLAFSMC